MNNEQKSQATSFCLHFKLPYRSRVHLFNEDKNNKAIFVFMSLLQSILNKYSKYIKLYKS